MGQLHYQQDNCGDINHNEWCSGCGQLLQRYYIHKPYKKPKAWDGHSYYCNCSKWPKGHVLNIG